jgi:hypothetical protein
MPTAEAHIETERPSRYLVQICQHINNISDKGRHLRHRPRARLAGDVQPRPEVAARPELRPHVQWSDTDGIVTFGGGRITLQASPGDLALRAEAANEEDLGRVQDLITGLLGRIGRRDHLTVNWQRSGTPTVQPGEA